MANYTTNISDLTASLVNGGLSSDVVSSIASLLGNQGENPIISDFTTMPTPSEIRGSNLAFFTLSPNLSETPQQVDLSVANAQDVKTLHTLIFNGDTSVVLTLPKMFDGVVVLGNGDNSVTTTGSKAVTLDTGSGNDTVSTGSGSDSITISGGSDSIRSGAGNDAIIINNTLAANDVVFADGGAGNNKLDLSAVHVTHVINADQGFKAKYEITLDNGAKIDIRNIDSIVYDNHGVAETIGIKDFLDHSI